MTSGIGQSTVRTTQQVAQTIAKQVAQEPSEFLEDVGQQIGVEGAKPQENYPQPQGQKVSDGNLQQEQQEDAAKSQRMMGALQKEIDDIKKQDLFDDLQAKVSQGAEVPLQDYTGLSMEQKQVLKAQMEAYKNQQKKIAEQESFNEVPTIHSKPSRRFGAGQKHEAERQQTRVEKPVQQSI